MTWWRWRGGMLRQIRFWFLILLTLNQVALLACLYVLLVKPAAESFSAVSLGLVDATLKQQSRNTRTLGLIHDHWESRGHIIVTSVPPQNLEPVPPFPGLRAVEALVHSTWGDQIKVGFSREPERMVWFQYQDGERFSVGIPMDQRMLGLVFLVSAVLLIFVLSGAASWAVAVRLTRPLDELSNTALRLGHGEDVGEISASRSAPAEIVRLANALNQMRGEINLMMQERERFLSGIAHDLRTPLSRMRVALELSDTRDDELTEGLREDIDEMRTILDQFIELSRLDAEKSEPLVCGDVTLLIRDVAMKYLRVHAPLSVSLSETPAIRFKPVALTRLLYNLIDNALRYGKGKVLLEAGADAEAIWFSVASQGGDALKDSALVKSLRAQDGFQQSGLGMAIVRRLAEVHDAGVNVSLQNDGERVVVVRFERRA